MQPFRRKGVHSNITYNKYGTVLTSNIERIEHFGYKRPQLPDEDKWVYKPKYDFSVSVDNSVEMEPEDAKKLFAVEREATDEEATYNLRMKNELHMADEQMRLVDRKLDSVKQVDMQLSRDPKVRYGVRKRTQKATVVSEPATLNNVLVEVDSLCPSNENIVLEDSTLDMLKSEYPELFLMLRAAEEKR